MYFLLSIREVLSSLGKYRQSLFYAFKTLMMLLVEACANYDYCYFDFLKKVQK